MRRLAEALGRGVRRVVGAADSPERCLGEALFALMGHLAKADGRVNPDEIAFAERLLREFDLDESGRRRAIALYDQGRAADFVLDPWLERCRRVLGARSEHARELLRLLARSALSDGRLTLVERGALERIALGLGFQRAALDQLLAELRRPPPPGSELSEAEALHLLGLSAPWTAAQVVAAYRRRISQLHPDRWLARGVEGASLQQAADEARRVRAAYERLRRARSGSKA